MTQKTGRLVCKRISSMMEKRVVPLDVEALACEAMVCFELNAGKICGGDLVKKDGEYVCPQCGRTWGFDDEEAIPFEESDLAAGHAESVFSPETQLDWGRGLGGKTDRNSMADVLGDDSEGMPEEFRLNMEAEMIIDTIAREANGEVSDKRPLGKFRDPLTWSRTKNIHVPLTHPLIQKLLTFGSDFMKKHGLNQKRNDSHRRFADMLAIYLRTMGKHYVKGLGVTWADPWRIAAVMFTLLFRESYRERYLEIRSNGGSKEFPELCLPDEVIVYFAEILKSCDPPVLPVI